MTNQTLLSISAIARATKRDRATIARRLDSAGAQPSGTRAGHPVYAIEVVLHALAGAQDAGADLDHMDPFKRKAWVASERDRLKLEVERGNMMERERVVDLFGRLNHAVVRELETLPDRLERDLRIGGQAVDYVRRAINGVRSDIASAIDRLRNQGPTP